MNKVLQNKIKRYSLAAGSVAAATGAHAQIDYTDITPDEVLNVGDGYYIDLDGDFTNDFYFTVDTFTTSTTSSVVSITAASIYGSVSSNSNEVMFVTSYLPVVSTTVTFADALSNGATINSTQSWTSYSGLLGAKGTFNSAPISVGPFRGTGDKYIGVRIDKGLGNYMYGWIRVNLNADANQLIIKDFAVETTLNTAINAGDGPATSLNEHSLEDKVNITSREGNVVINLNGIPSANAKILNATGQELASTSISEGSNEITTSGASGLCIVEVTSGDAVIRKKVVLN